MTSWQDYLAFLGSLSKTLEELTQVEQEKNAAAAQGDLIGVEDCMKREQVLSLTLRGYDQKRDRMLADLGLQGVPLRELQRHSPKELLMETKSAVELLRSRYALFQAASEAARVTLEVNLRAIEKEQAVLAGDSAQAAETRKSFQTDFRA